MPKQRLNTRRYASIQYILNIIMRLAIPTLLLFKTPYAPCIGFLMVALVFGLAQKYPFQAHMARNHHIIAAFVMRLLLRRENPFSDALSQLKWIFTISERRNETKRKSIRNIWTNNNIIMKPFSAYIIIFV